MNTFGTWLRTMRERTFYGDHIMTQEEFTAELERRYTKPVKSSNEEKKITKASISTWELGTKNAPLQDNRFVEAVADIFNVSVAEVLRGSGYDLGTDYDDIDETKRLLLEAYDSGNLDRLIRQALDAHAARALRQSRLESSSDPSVEPCADHGHTGSLRE